MDFTVAKIRELSQAPHDAMALLLEAQRAATSAYAPYSRFVVGAAVATTDGEIYRGCNMENASYGLTVCAEVGALQSALEHRRLNKIKSIAIVGGSAELAKTKGAAAVTPCGRCRQLIFEASELSQGDIEVWCADLALSTFLHAKISDLLPGAFGPTSLNVAQDWFAISARLQERLSKAALKATSDNKARDA